MSEFLNDHQDLIIRKIAALKHLVPKKSQSTNGKTKHILEKLKQKTKEMNTFHDFAKKSSIGILTLN